MPKTPARDDYFAQSFRFTPEQAATIKEEAKRLGSTTAFVRELIDDYRTMFGLPGIQVEVLEADMKNLTRRSRNQRGMDSGRSNPGGVASVRGKPA